MSVSLRDRTPTQKDFITSFRAFNNAVMGTVNALPHRRRKWLGDPIQNIMADIELEAMSVANDSLKELNVASNDATIDKIYENLKALEKPFYSLWSVRNFKPARMKKWITLMMKFARDLSRAYIDKSKKPKLSKNFFEAPDFSVRSNFKILDTALKLQGETHSKVIKACGKNITASSVNILGISDNIVYYIHKGNKEWAKSIDGLTKRQACFKKAEMYLKNMDYPMYTIAFIHGYTESSTKKWISLLTSCRTQLTKLIEKEKAQLDELIAKEQSKSEGDNAKETPAK